jgi:hypothetical protein
LSEKSCIWVQHHKVAKHDRSLFFLQSCKRLTVCPLVARSSMLQDLTIALPATACVILGPGELDLRRVTFTGAAPAPCSSCDCFACVINAWATCCTLWACNLLRHSAAHSHLLSQ